ncbi:MAG: alpha/beta fold hydrolase [Vulcanimicrobiaceae bacterium]
MDEALSGAMRVTCGYAAVNATHLYYEIAGRGSPLVLIHGLDLDARVWDGQFEAFAEHHRVIRYDVRGFGRSFPPTSAEFRHADDLHALLEFMEAPKAHMLALCMGGRIAIAHALLYPDATLSLILVDSSLDGDPWTAVSTSDAAGIRAQLNRLAAQYSGWGWMNEHAATEIGRSVNDRLHEIRMPVLVISGERVPPNVQRVSDILALGIHDARKVVMKGAGHLCNVERAQAFNSIVLSFLDVAEAREDACG